jgi:hypothetical protein
MWNYGYRNEIYYDYEAIRNKQKQIKTCTKNRLKRKKKKKCL